MKNSDSLSWSVTYKLSLLQRLILDLKNANENNEEWQSGSFRNNSFNRHFFFYLSSFFKKQSRTYSLEIYTDRNN